MVTIFDPTGLLALILLVYVVDWSCGPCVFLVTRTVRTPYCGLLGQASSITLILTLRKKKHFIRNLLLKTPKQTDIQLCLHMCPLLTLLYQIYKLNSFTFFLLLNVWNKVRNSGDSYSVGSTFQSIRLRWISKRYISSIRVNLEEAWWWEITHNAVLGFALFVEKTYKTINCVCCWFLIIQYTCSYKALIWKYHLITHCTTKMARYLDYSSEYLIKNLQFLLFYQ